MSKKQSLIINVLVVAILVVIAVGGSYAYFTANISGTESATTVTVQGGEMKITFSGGNDISVANIYPKSAAVASKAFTLNGTNTTDLNMGYSLSLIVDSNTFSTGALKYTLTSVNTGNSGTVIANIVTGVSISNGAKTYALGNAYFATGSNKVHTYTLNIYFPDTGADQNADQGKSFKAHVGITPAT